MGAVRFLDCLAGRAVERAFGETLLVLPMAAARNAAPQADPERNPLAIRAVFSIAPEDRALFADRKGGANTVGPTRVQLSGTWATVTAAELARLGYPPVQGDIVVLVDRSGAPRFRITAADLDDLGAATLHLTREAAP